MYIPKLLRGAHFGPKVKFLLACNIGMAPPERKGHFCILLMVINRNRFFLLMHKGLQKVHRQLA